MLELINRNVLSAYSEEYRAEDILPLDLLPTLSACHYWKVETTENIYCLRRWPRGIPERGQLEFQQAVLWHVVYEGVDFVPLPIETGDYKGFIPFDGAFWELMPWIGSPSPKPFEAEFIQVASAMMSLAQFHQAVSSFPLPDFPVSVSLKIRDQLTQWERWDAGRFSKLHQALQKTCNRTDRLNRRRLAESGLRFLEFARSQVDRTRFSLARSARFSVPIQAIIGNCCERHLRFDQEGLCGMIDFKEITVDSVAWDVASLLRSLAGNDGRLWNLGLNAFQNIRPLSEVELFLVDSFDCSHNLLEGLDYLANVFLLDQPFTDRRLLEMDRRIALWSRLFIDEIDRRRTA